MVSETPVAPAPSASGPVTGGLGMILPTFPQHSPLLPARTLTGLCRGAERAGAGALWACDHLFWHGPALEVFSALGAAAAATTRVAVGSCVLQLPLRSPAVVAKQAASLQHLSGGRLVLGVGIGSHRGEYEAAGTPFGTRGRTLDAGIDAMRRAWRADQGHRYAQLPPAGAVPVWIGGSSEAALRRAARFGDGWIPLFVPPQDYAAALGRLDEEVERAGRDPAAVARAVVAFVAPGDERASDRGLAWMASLYGLPAASFARHLVTGDVGRCAAYLVRLVEAGADHVAVFVTDDEPLVQFEDLAGEFAGRLARGASDRVGARPVAAGLPS